LPRREILRGSCGLVEICLGTNPSQALKSRPFRPLSEIPSRRRTQSLADKYAQRRSGLERCGDPRVAGMIEPPPPGAAVHCPMLVVRRIQPMALRDPAASAPTTAPPPLHQMALSYVATQALHIAAQLDIAGRIGDGAADAATIARETGANPSSLARLLRALVAFGVLEVVDDGRFRLTPIGAQLRPDFPGSFRSFARIHGGEIAWHSCGDLLNSVRTGETAFVYVFGASPYEYLAAHPQLAEVFNDAMTAITFQIAPAIASACGLSGSIAVMDVGGGNGTLLAEILRASPALSGVLFDTPSGATGAQLETTKPSRIRHIFICTIPKTPKLRTTNPRRQAPRRRQANRRPSTQRLWVRPLRKSHPTAILWATTKAGSCERHTASPGVRGS
jgi:hypothetical protein